MNKSDLISALSEEANMSKKQVAHFLETMKRIFIRQLCKGQKIQWAGLGTLQVALRAARKGINPANKKLLDLPESATARFRAGKNLKEQLRMALLNK